MAGISTTITIEDELRLCEVKGELGYFHTWEHFSQRFPASPMVGGTPAGIESAVLGIVEFSDRVERVYPDKIKFCDEKNQLLQALQAGRGGQNGKKED